MVVSHEVVHEPQFAFVLRGTQALPQRVVPGPQHMSPPVPEVQVPPLVVQLLVHVPQVVSDAGLLHTPPQLIDPAAQQMPPTLTLPLSQQMPPSQVAVESQTAPGQVPAVVQWFSSVSGSTHSPLQLILPPVQFVVAVHAPLKQTWVALHCVPHAPQLFGSVASVTHAVAGPPATGHDISEMSQPEVHVPSLQAGFGFVQAAPPAPMQPPQAPGFVSISTQTPAQ
jgi:hypothetical protein